MSTGPYSEEESVSEGIALPSRKRDPEPPPPDTSKPGPKPSLPDVGKPQPTGQSTSSQPVQVEPGSPSPGRGEPHWSLRTPRRPFVPPGTVSTVGRRKEAVARVRLVPGSGRYYLNGRTLEEYFPNRVHQMLVATPFVEADRLGSYDVIATLHGGGISGQAGALTLGVARALIAADEGLRPPLKRAGLLTRDSRIKERKKYGLKKARKAPQYSKR